LIKNKSLEEGKINYLAKELAQMDYFLLLDEENHFLKIKKTIQLLQSINEISFVQLIDTTKLKSKDNFIF
jgi:ABC-type cobalamin/Fe3+-siderophores transport system ATPase subunit